MILVLKWDFVEGDVTTNNDASLKAGPNDGFSLRFVCFGNEHGFVPFCLTDRPKYTIHEITRNHTNKYLCRFVLFRGSCLTLRFWRLDSPLISVLVLVADRRVSASPFLHISVGAGDFLVKII